MAMYKVRYTVYKAPDGKTLKGPTALHFLGDLCSAMGLIGILYGILCIMEERGVAQLIGAGILAVAGFALCIVLHKKAKKNAGRIFLEALANMEKQESVNQG